MDSTPQPFGCSYDRQLSCHLREEIGTTVKQKLVLNACSSPQGTPLKQ